jgi:hypothetical protein
VKVKVEKKGEEVNALGCRGKYLGMESRISERNSYNKHLIGVH